MSEKKHWTREETISLISTWKLRRELWDNSDPNNRNYRKKELGFQELAVEFNTLEVEIRRKLHNLRTQYNQEIRKITKRIQQGEPPSSSWEFFKSLQFLPSSYMFSNASKSETDIDFDHLNPKNEQIYIEIEPDPLDLDLLTTPAHKRKTVKRKSGDSPKESTQFDYLKPNEDEFDIIAQLWAHELRKTSPEQQLYAKKAIHDIIFEAQLGTLHRDSVIINKVDSLPV